LILVSNSQVQAQDEDYRIHVNKDKGYSWASDIQGRFTIRLLGDETRVKEVAFLIDGTILSTVNSAPFSDQFETGDFSEGTHNLSAEVHLKDGSQVTTSALVYSFLGSAQVNEQMKPFFIGIGGALLGIFVIVALVQWLFFKKKKTSPRAPGEPRSYGPLGGTICPKCGRPFSRHLFGLNLLTHRLERCDNCGKWVMTKRANPAELQAAEQAELEEVIADEEALPTKENLEGNLEDTRYFDGL